MRLHLDAHLRLGICIYELVLPICSYIKYFPKNPHNCNRNYPEPVILLKKYLESVFEGPPPERAKHIFQILEKTAETLSMPLEGVCRCLIDEELGDHVLTSVNEFMIAVVQSAPSDPINKLLEFYSDIVHLAFGLRPEDKKGEEIIVRRFESQWHRKGAGSVWLVSGAWFRAWSDFCKNRTDAPHPGPIDNSALCDRSRATAGEVFVFEERGQHAVADLSKSAVSLSRLSLDFLCDIYGSPRVNFVRPFAAESGSVLFDTVSVALYRHKYAQSTQNASALAAEKELDIELDGTGIIWPTVTTVKSLRTDLSKVKRQNVDNIRLWVLNDQKERKLLEVSEKLVSALGKSGTFTICINFGEIFEKSWNCANFRFG